VGLEARSGLGRGEKEMMKEVPFPGSELNLNTSIVLFYN